MAKKKKHVKILNTWARSPYDLHPICRCISVVLPAYRHT